MSALGQKRTFAVHQPMSASPPIATSIAYFHEGSPLRVCNSGSNLCKKQSLTVAFDRAVLRFSPIPLHSLHTGPPVRGILAGLPGHRPMAAPFIWLGGGRTEPRHWPTNHWPKPTRLDIDASSNSPLAETVDDSCSILISVLALASACFPNTRPCIANLRAAHSPMKRRATAMNNNHRKRNFTPSDDTLIREQPVTGIGLNTLEAILRISRDTLMRRADELGVTLLVSDDRDGAHAKAPPYRGTRRSVTGTIEGGAWRPEVI
jgi:hypothetical protein